MGRMLQSRFLRKTLVLGAGAVVFQTIYSSNSCFEFATSFGLSALNFCSILNCTGTSLFNLCDPQVLLVDCVAPT